MIPIEYIPTLSSLHRTVLKTKNMMDNLKGDGGRSGQGITYV
jgi:hypothetical protein